MNQIVPAKLPRLGELAFLGVAVFILAASGVLSFREWRGYKTNREALQDGRRLLHLTRDVLAGLTDAETGQRGFLLTGREDYLLPYTKALTSVPDDLAKLKRMSAGEPQELARILRLEKLAGEKLREVRQTVDLRRGAGFNAAIDVVQTDRGRLAMDEIRKLCAGIEQEQDRSVEERSRQMAADGTRVRLGTVLGTVVLCGLLSVATVRIHGATSRREKLIRDLDEASRVTREVRDLLKTTLMSIGDGVIATDVEARVTFLNAVAISLTGWERHEAEGRPLDEVFRIVSEQTRQVVESPAGRVLREGRVLGLANHTLLVAKDGREVPIDDSGAPIRDARGRIVGVVLVFRDVSERRAAERERERLRREAEMQHARLESLFRQAPAMINIHSGPEHVFEFVHPLTMQLLGGRDVTGLRIADVLPDATARDLIQSMDEAYSTGKAVVLGDLPMFGETYFSVICNPWKDGEGRVAGVMTLAIDVTGQVRARREMESTQNKLRETAKLESLGVLAGGVAHDFNNLLVGILGNASLALEEISESSPAYAMVKDIVHASERAANLTRQMLAYSGRGRFVIEMVDLSKLVREMVSLTRSAIPRTVQLRLQLAPDLPPVEADMAQLQQLIMNLVINGAEACGEGPGMVTVRTQSCEVDEEEAAALPVPFEIRPGTYVCLEVQDTGSGIHPDVLPKIFDPFFTTKFAGRGLGLSAVQGIVRGHGGSIRIETAPGRGSTFSVILPPAEGKLPDRSGDGRVDKQLFAGSGTVLIVDDEDVVRHTAVSALERRGYRTLSAENGREAVELFRTVADEVSVVLLDLTMPVMSGEETLRELRRIRPDVLVVLTSGFSEAEAVSHFPGHTLAGFLQKPYTAASVAEAVRAALAEGGRGQAART